MKFTKMHGAGNDYVYVNCFTEVIENPSLFSQKVSNRNFGVGSDGLIMICPSDKGDARMEMYNADGSRAEMCGNGVRCVAKYVHDHGISDHNPLKIETDAGIKVIRLILDEKGKAVQAEVDMGEPIMKPCDIPVDLPGESIVDMPVTVDGREYRITCVSMGNPHCTVFVDDTKSLDIEKIGPYFESHKIFPKRVNTEFVQILSRTEINMRVWERGSGETLACGTGTTACVYACILNGLTEDKVLVHLLGGDLTISYNRENNHLFMTGPATEVFSGEFDESFLK